MVLFIYGQDTYRSRQKLNEIIERYKKTQKSGLNLIYLDVQKLNYQDLKDKFQQRAMFKEKKLIVFKNFFLNQSLKENLLKDFKKLTGISDLFLFYETDKIRESDKLFKLLKKYATCQEFKPLEGQGLRNWIKKEFERWGAKIEPKAIEELIGFIGNDSWQLSSEIQKIVSYKKGASVQLKDLELLVKPKIDSDIFKTIDAIAAKDKKQALLLLKKHLEKGDHPLYLLKMINFQLRNLLIMKSLTGDSHFNSYYSRLLPKKLGMHPFVIKKTIQQTRRFSFEELKRIYRKVFEADFNIKTGKIESETALDLLIAEI